MDRSAGAHLPGAHQQVEQGRHLGGEQTLAKSPFLPLPLFPPSPSLSPSHSAPSQSGRTVITTIHQPSSRLFHTFDKLLLLSEGNAIYFGRASDAMSYFSSLEFAPMFASNPADFLLDLANGTTADISMPARLTDGEEWQEKSAKEQQTQMKEVRGGGEGMWGGEG